MGDSIKVAVRVRPFNKREIDFKVRGLAAGMRLLLGANIRSR